MSLIWSFSKSEGIWEVAKGHFKKEERKENRCLQCKLGNIIILMLEKILGQILQYKFKARPGRGKTLPT